MLASRTHWRILVGTILVLMGLAWVAPRFIPAPEIQENRVLAQAPAWPHRLQDIRAFRKAADPYIADNFPIRPHLIGLLNRLRMMVGVSGSERVIVGRDGWLFFDDGSHLGASRGDPPMTGPEVRQWLVSLAGRNDALGARGIRYLVVAAPVKETIYPQFGPFWYAGPSAVRPTIQLPALARKAQAGEVLYLHPYIAEATRAGRKTFSRHDTHWTGYGAYAGYVGLLSKLQGMGITDGPRPLSDFQLVGGDQKARPRDLALMLGVASFVDIDFPHIDNPKGLARLRVTYLSDKQDDAAPQVWDTGEAGKPVLLMTRDSFSYQLLPMMLSHFSRIVLAHNQDGFFRQDLIDRFKPDVVILETVEHGLRISMADGPSPSPSLSSAAVGRIDQAIAAAGFAKALPPPGLAPTNARTLAELSAAKPAKRCAVDTATLTVGADGTGMLKVAGWIYELGLWNASRDGKVRLQGPGVDLVAPVQIDLPRPDVAEALHNPTAGTSGYSKAYPVVKLQPGAYSATVYRRSGKRWIACVGQQQLTVPSTG